MWSVVVTRSDGEEGVRGVVGAKCVGSGGSESGSSVSVWRAVKIRVWVGCVGSGESRVGSGGGCLGSGGELWGVVDDRALMKRVRRHSVKGGWRGWRGWSMCWNNETRI